MKFDIFYYITILKQFIYWIAQTMIANDAVACNNWSYKWQCFIDTVYCKIPKNSAKNNKLFFFLVDFLQIYFTLHIRLNFRYIHIIMTTLFWFPWSQLPNFFMPTSSMIIWNSRWHPKKEWKKSWSWNILTYVIYMLKFSIIPKIQSTNAIEMHQKLFIFCNDLTITTLLSYGNYSTTVSNNKILYLSFLHLATRIEKNIHKTRHKVIFAQIMYNWNAAGCEL